MALTVTHAFVSSIADSSAAQVAGKVLPQSMWNQPHTVSGTMLAVDVENIPSGGVTATDVQAAINQLYSLIPSPGPGTDPLFLIHGEQINVTNPATDGNEFDRYGLLVNSTTTCVNNDPSFSNTSAASFRINALHGQGNYNILTQAKITFFALSNSTTAVASGQRFVQGNTMNAYGMGDAAIYGAQTVTFASGPIDGDEGVGWQLASVVQQQTFRSLTNIAAVPTPCTINTTVNQVGGIAKSQFAQTVTVVDTTGIAVGGNFWIVVDQELPTSGSNMESVKVISFDATHITGIFRCNHNNGCTIKACLLLQLNSHFTLGQDRFLVNYDQMTYSVGNIASISGGGFNGAGGANWTVNMVGGNALNIGCITLPSDDCTITPYTIANPNKAIYQIKLIASPTSIAIMSTTIAADFSYRGFGPPPSGRGAANQPYTIYPCAKILRIAEGMVICENSTSVWAIGDQVEQPITAYPDVTGFIYRMACYSTGGTYRSFMQVMNSGARAFGSALEFPGWDNAIAPGGDGYNWGALITSNARVLTILDFNQCISSTIGIGLPSGDGTGGFTDAGGSIVWGGRALKPNTVNGGFDMLLTAGSHGTLEFSGPNTARNLDTLFSLMSWGSNIILTYRGTGQRPHMTFDRDGDGTDPVNYCRARLGYDNNPFPPSFIIETQQLGGVTSQSDIVLKTNGTEQLRLLGGFSGLNGIQFSNPASFSANGGVATAVTGVGPAGASTTVQKWLTIKDDGGVTRYIPCF